MIGIAGVDDDERREALAGVELRVPVERLAPLPPGTFYRHDLVGCRVETRDGRTGRRRSSDVEGTLGGSRLVVAAATAAKC